MDLYWTVIPTGWRCLVSGHRITLSDPGSGVTRWEIDGYAPAGWYRVAQGDSTDLLAARAAALAALQAVEDAP